MFKEVQKWYSFCIKDVKKMYERYFKEDLILLDFFTLTLSMTQCFEAMSVSEMAYEMARDEARHGKAFEGLLKRYFA